VLAPPRAPRRCDLAACAQEEPDGGPVRSTGAVRASEILRVLQGGGRPTPTGRAVAELGRQVATDTVRWIGSDWQLQLQPDGSESPTAQSVSSLTGFVPWSGL